MDRNTIYAGVSVVLAGLLGFTWAQGRSALSADEPKSVGGEIAVVDIARVFKGHKRFLARGEEFKREMERAGEDAKTMLDAARQLQEELKRHKPGSAEHGRIQKELQEKAVDLKKFQDDLQKHMIHEQQQISLATYQSIVDEVQRIAESRGFKLVLNFSSEPIDAKEDNAGLQDKTMQMIQAQAMQTNQVLSRQVLYQNGLDITDDVLQAVN